MQPLKISDKSGQYSYFHILYTLHQSFIPKNVYVQLHSAIFHLCIEPELHFNFTRMFQHFENLLRFRNNPRVQTSSIFSSTFQTVSPRLFSVPLKSLFCLKLHSRKLVVKLFHNTLYPIIF